MRIFHNQCSSNFSFITYVIGCFVSLIFFAQQSDYSYGQSEKHTSHNNQDHRHTVYLNDLRIEFPENLEKQKYKPGRLILTEIKLFNENQDRPISADLIFNTQNVQIIDITGFGENSHRHLKVYKRAKDTRVKVSKLQNRKPIVLLVEFRFGKQGLGSSVIDTQSALNVLLRHRVHKRNVLKKRKSFTWSFASCAANYSSALSALVSDELTQIDQALRHVRAIGDRSSSKWLFPPQRFVKKRTQKKICRRTKRSWDASRKRWQRKCVSYRVRNKVVRKKIKRSSDEVKVYNLAGRYIKNRTRAPKLLKRGNHGWTVAKISSDLKIYAKQKAHPAMCTGVGTMMGFFNSKLGGLRRDTKKVSVAMETASSLAEKKVQELSTAFQLYKVETAPQSSLAFENRSVPKGDVRRPDQDALSSLINSLAPQNRTEKVQSSKTTNPFMSLKSTKPSQSIEALIKNNSVKSLLSRVALEMNDNTLSERISNEKDLAYSFRMLHSKLDFIKDEKLYNQNIRVLLHDTLTTLEAAYHLGTVRGHYETVLNAVNGSMISITEAHSKSCTC